MNKTDPPQSSQPWLFQGRPPLIAHRGYAQCYPENTLLALESAVAAGAKFLEFDIQLSKDAVPVLLHDDDLLRTAGLDLSVFQADIAQLEKISVGEHQRFGDRFLSTTPIRLEHLCVQLNDWPEVSAFIEIKGESVERFGVDRVVRALLAATESLVNEHVFISFSAEVVQHIQCISNKRTGWIIRQWNQNSLEMLQGLSPDFVFCNYKKVPKNEPLPRIGPHWALYEIDTMEKLSVSRKIGADLIETMMVENMLEKLAAGAPIK